MNAAADNSVSPTQRLPDTCQCAMGEASIRASVCSTPPDMPQTTNTPTASSANSLTTASSAIAMTTP